MRVAELHPEFRTTIPTDDPARALADIAMDCPICGLRLSFKAWWQAGPRDGFHGMTADVNPAIDWDTLNVDPSIRYEPGSAHGRKSTCVPHFNIKNGKVLLA